MSFNFDVKAEFEEARVSSLKIGKTRIITPNYVIVHSDLKNLVKGSNFINTKPIDIKLHEIVVDYSDQMNVNHLLNNTEASNALIEKIAKMSKSKKENIFQFRTKKDVILSSEQLVKIVQIQSDSERLSVITIPDANRKYDYNWKNTMIKAIEEAQIACEIGTTNVYMPIISLEQPTKNVEEKIKWLLGRNVPAIGLRAWGKFPKRLYKATKWVREINKNIWIHMFDLEKKFLDTSQMHLAPIAGVDTISIRKKYSSGGPSRPLDTGDFPTPRPPPQKVIKRPRKDFFEGQALGFFSEEERVKTFGHDLNCNCPLCQKATRNMDLVMNMVARYERNALLKIHESYGFIQEMKEIEKNIRDNTLGDYYMDKLLITQKLDHIETKYPNIKKLIKER